MLNETDSQGCTPLHYACQSGNLASLSALLKMGVSAREKTCKHQSPLHFASMYGRYNACRRLLDSNQVRTCVLVFWCCFNERWR